MPNLPSISQVYIPNKKQSLDYVSLYEEKIGSDNPIYLFIIIEIKGSKKSSVTKNNTDFDKLTESMAKILKRTYLNEIRTTSDTFEKALENINQELSELARKGLTGWYKKLNALVGVIYKNQASVSVTGNASSFLLRENQFTHITDSISSGSKPHPLKTFVNFASGQLSKDDLVIFSTANLYNYVSLEKLRNIFHNTGLEPATKDIIETLKQDAELSDAFSSFFIKITPQIQMPENELGPLVTSDSHTIIEDTPIDSRRGEQTLTWLKKFGQISWQTILQIGAGAVWAYRKIVQSSQKGKSSEYSYLTEKKSPKRKVLLVTFIVLAFILVVNVIFANFRRAENDTLKEMESLLEQASLNTSDAEAALIYDDQNSALASILKAKEDIDTVLASSFLQEEAEMLSEKINKLFDQLNKRNTVAVQKLAAFTVSPDQLVYAGNGFIGFNSFTDSFEEYISGGQVSLLLINIPEEGNIIDSTYDNNSVLFLGDNGAIYSLDQNRASLTAVSPTSSDQNLGLNLAGFSVYTGRAYTIDKNRSQVLRYPPIGNGFAAPGDWLDQPFDFSDAKDLSVDGSIYVLEGNQVTFFTQGAKLEFDLPPMAESIENPKKIYTNSDSQFIYILDSGKNRILVITKQGTLASQLISDSFSDLKDFYVDESIKTMYVLNGDELLSFAY